MLRRDLAGIGYNLLKNVPRADLQEFVLAVFSANNDQTILDHQRATRFAKQLVDGGQADLEGTRVLKEAIANQNVYIKVDNPTCRCCGR